MKTLSWGAALMGLLTILAGATNASAQAVLDVENFNHDTVSFTVTNSPDMDGTRNGDYTVSGGNIVPSNLNGVSLTNLYCIQYATEIYVRGTYSAATNTLGTVDGGKAVYGADQVAWLMKNIEPTVGTDLTQQSGLQLAIWNVVTDGTFTVNHGSGQTSAEIYNAYTADILALHGGNLSNPAKAAPVSDVLWISPNDGNTNSPTYYQALVTSDPAVVPEPATLAMTATSLFVLGGVLWRRRKSATV